MINLFRVDKSGKSRTRKIPLLPRFGLVVDVAGRRISFRHAPLIETMVNLVERGPTLSNLQKIVSEQLHEISFPPKRRNKTLDVRARTVSRKARG